LFGTLPADRISDFITALILASPMDIGEYVLDTDASNYGLGAVPQQQQEGYEIRVMAYEATRFRVLSRITVQFADIYWPLYSDFSSSVNSCWESIFCCGWSIRLLLIFGNPLILWIRQPDGSK
jgi:RNase H-like domain found in reverse transcriptase